ncbi:MAG: MFS transporter [Theionarchaea archaeon]|nr:MFS transporter [Theionarchaea archaeon]
MSKSPDEFDTQANRPDSLFHLLKTRNCLALWSSSMLSSIGSNISYIALSYYIFEKTGSPISVGVLMIMFTAPSVLFGIPAGDLVDRWPKKKVMITVDVLRALLIFSITFTRNIEAIFALVLVSYILNQLHYNGRDGLIPALVAENDLAPANSFLQSSLQVASFAGPALGGFIVAFGGVTSALYVDALTFVCSALITVLLRPKGEKLNKSPLSEWKHEVMGGFHVLKNDFILKTLIVLMAVGMLSVGMIRMLLVILSETPLSVGSEGLGTLFSSLALGSFAGSLILGKYSKGISLLRLTVSGYFVLAITFLVVPAEIMIIEGVMAFWVAVMVLFVTGLGNIAVLIGALTIIQKRSPRERIGRVLGVAYALNGAGSIISLVVGGWAAEIVGAEPVFLGAGMLLLVVTGIMYCILGNKRNEES